MSATAKIADVREWPMGLKIEHVVEAAAIANRVSVSVLMGRSSQWGARQARIHAYELCRYRLGLSPQECAAAIGRKSHHNMERISAFRRRLGIDPGASEALFAEAMLRARKGKSDDEAM